MNKHNDDLWEGCNFTAGMYNGVGIVDEGNQILVKDNASGLSWTGSEPH